MICYESGLAVILDVDMWIKWGALAVPFIALGAIKVALNQLKVSREETRRSTAYTAYQQYLSLCLEHSDLAKGCESEIYKDDFKYGKYKWFLSNMLFSFEQIIEVLPKDKEWKSSIKSQLLRHRWHLVKAKSIKEKQWSPEMSAIINEVIAITKIGDTSLNQGDCQL